MTHDEPTEGAVAAAKAVLPGLLRRFDRDPDESRRRIRQLLERDVEAFYRAAIESLGAADGSAGERYLVSTLLRHDLLLRALCEPTLSAPQAHAVIRMAAEVNPGSSCLLARGLSDEKLAENFGPQALFRMIDLLSSACGTERILPFLRLLVRHPDPHVRSKAVLLVGPYEGPGWLQARLSEPDARVRASATEALGALRGPAVEALLLAAAGDDNNRVAATALVELYRHGYADSAEALVRMANHASPRFQASAAWAMGMTGDPEFVPTLAHMLANAEPSVRKPAFAALKRIRSSPPTANPQRLRLSDHAERRKALAAELPDWQRMLLQSRR